MPTRVTVCIPVYNETDVIERTLSCLKRQTLTDFRVIISDNRSTDDTYEKVRTFIEDDKRFRAMRQSRNIGSPENFKFLAQRIKTKFAIFVGAHDEISENLLEDLLSVLECNPKLIGVVPRIVCDEAAGPVVKPQFDLRQIRKPINRYLITLLSNSFALHGLYRTPMLKESMARMPNVIGAGALFLCRMAILGRIGTSDNSTYYFWKRHQKLDHGARRRRQQKNMQLKSTWFSGTRMAWEFFKLPFVAKLPKSSFRTRLGLFVAFPIVFIRYSSTIAADFKFNSALKRTFTPEKIRATSRKVINLPRRALSALARRAKLCKAILASGSARLQNPSRTPENDS